MSQTYEVPPIPHANEGRTVASWVTMAGLFVGIVLLGVGFAMAQNAIVMLVGGAVVAVGLIAGAILRAAGFGQKQRQRP